MNDRAEITTRLADRLKEERAAKGLSLDALAKLSGVSRSMLSQIERGESSPTVASLWNLTRALNIDFSTLTRLQRANSAGNSCQIGAIIGFNEMIVEIDIATLQYHSTNMHWSSLAHL